MAERVRRLSECLSGWLGYFRLVETPTPLDDLDEWLGRGLRAVRWKEWKRGRARYRMLRSLAVPHFTARQGWSKKGAWPIAHGGAMQVALPRSYWAGQGLVSLVDRWSRVRVV